MLEDIRLHIDDDEIQDAREAKLADRILKTYRANIIAFRATIPSLASKIANPELATYSIFFNKYDQLNIVDIGKGQTFYGLNPHEEILAQVSHFTSYPVSFTLHDQCSPESSAKIDNSSLNATDKLKHKIAQRQRANPLTGNEFIECVVVLGCGLGKHIEHLLRNFQIKYLIVYEPEQQFFTCSSYAQDWRVIFELAKEKNTQIFLQIGKDGRDINDDLNELDRHVGVKKVYLYKHYNHPVFDEIEASVTKDGRGSLTSDFAAKLDKQISNEFVPRWTSPLDFNDVSVIAESTSLFTENLAAFEKFFPDIYEFFKNYTPKLWCPVQHSSGDINLANAEYLLPWHSNDVKEQALTQLDYFKKHPNLDGLVLGYNGKKLAHYTHYQFVKNTESLLQKSYGDTGELPQDIESLILFGVGVGYQLEALTASHDIKKLFICEPNPDFLFASLFAINWSRILNKFDEEKTRIYINLGDDENHLFESLLNQFHSIGAYILNETYFYRPYYNAVLDATVTKLREQLQVMVSMGEYFDHALYGISQTRENLRRGYRFLSAQPSKQLSMQDKEVPVFIVGNGPSLDQTIDAIKEHQDKAIIVSCGTSLRVLNRHGIKPDFHAEVEQNRATFDWVNRVEDDAYLKDINLLSCNGIHPDTCDLFKDVFIVFKEGESSTASALAVLEKSQYKALRYLYPTVGNLAIDIFREIGFSEIYIVGVDLGFINQGYHHSKQSGYYQEDGSETYDYQKFNNTSLTVRGNFRTQVNTKHEFKVAIQVLEKSLLTKKKYQHVYNCSDGAYIRGTQPLSHENILITASPQQKIHCLEKIQTTLFINDDHPDKVDKFDTKYSHEQLVKELHAFSDLIAKEQITVSDVRKLVDQQREFLFGSYRHGRSLFFFYLYGTVNYANAVLIKLLHSSSDEELSNTAKEGLTMWRDYFENIKDICSSPKVKYDLSGYMPWVTSMLRLKNQLSGSSLLLVADDLNAYRAACSLIENHYPWLGRFKFVLPEQIASEVSEQYDFVIYHCDYQSIGVEVEKITGTLNTLRLVCTSLENVEKEAGSIIASYDALAPSLPPETSDAHKINTVYSEIAFGLNFCLNCIESQFAILKRLIPEGETSFFEDQLINISNLEAFNFSEFITFHEAGSNPEGVMARSGERGTPLANVTTFDTLKIIDNDYAAHVYESQSCIRTSE